MRNRIFGSALVLGFAVIAVGCATSEEWAEWRAHNSHFASDKHMGFSARNREGSAPRVARSRHRRRPLGELVGEGHHGQPRPDLPELAGQLRRCPRWAAAGCLALALGAGAGPAPRSHRREGHPARALLRPPRGGPSRPPTRRACSSTRSTSTGACPGWTSRSRASASSGPSSRRVTTATSRPGSSSTSRRIPQFAALPQARRMSAMFSRFGMDSCAGWSAPPRTWSADADVHGFSVVVSWLKPGTLRPGRPAGERERRRLHGQGQRARLPRAAAAGRRARRVGCARSPSTASRTSARSPSRSGTTSSWPPSSCRTTSPRPESPVNLRSMKRPIRQKTQFSLIYVLIAAVVLSVGAELARRAPDRGRSR